MKNKTTNFIILIVLLAFHISAQSQENVGIGTTTPEVTALLDLVSTDKGLLVPRLTTANRDAIATPATGLMIYNTTNNRFEYYTGATWVPILTNGIISLDNSRIFVGNASNIATGVVLSGDATITNAGVLTIANNAITTAKINNNAITTAKIGNNQVTTAKIGDTQVTNAKLATGIDATKLADGSVDNTEFQYLNGVTSNIQTQLDSKVSGTLLNTNIFVGNASNLATGVAMSGDATISNAGVLTIANDAITTAKIGNTQVTNAKLAAAIDATKLADGSVDNTEFQYLNGVTSNIQTQLDSKVSGTLLNTNIFVGNASNLATGVAMSGDATISNAGVLTIGNDAITTAKIGNLQVTNAKLASGIDATKLADGSIDNTEFQFLNGVTSNIQTQLDAKMTNALTNTNIFVGDASNVATGVAMSGDATISNAGVLTIGNDAITTAKIGNTQITNAKLATGIDATKLADGSIDNTEFQFLNGVTSNIQTQLDAKMTNALTNTNIFVGDALNVATGVAMSGDATISNAGVLTIANDAITTAKIIDNAVDGAKIQITGNTIGSMMYYDGTDWVQLSPGISGQLLQTSGAAAPIWVNAPSGSLPPGSDKQTLRHNGTDWVVSSNLSNDGTNIGVGISTPTALVHQDGGDATAAYHKFTAGTTTGTTASDGFDIGVSSTGIAELRQLESSDMIFATNNTERMRLFANGKLSINTATAPHDTVQVLIDGDVRITQDLIVDGNIDPIALILQPQATAPNITTKGTIYFDNTSNDIKFYNGSAWTTFGAVLNDDQEVTGNVSLLSSGPASELRFYEPTADGNNFTAFKARTQNANISYNLPVSQGAADSYLKNDGSGNLSWGTVSASNTLTVTHLTGRDDYNVGSSDQVIVASFTGGSKNINLPSAASNTGRVIYIKKGVVGVSTDRIYLIPQEGELIDGAANKFIRLEGARRIVSDGSNWWVISSYNE
ncbi:MAG: hypothetical protein M9949_07420 [Candidatus Kapabacteria bacterium]|nr:hypothetical protein [Candidatus Kapabacteria bacterium]